MKRALFAVALLVAVPASAQTFQPQPRQRRPDWALFGSGVANTSQRLILTATFGGGYDDDLSPNPAATAPFKDGPFGSAGANLTYGVDMDKVQGAVGFGVYGRNYRAELKEPFIGTYSLTSHLSFALGDKSGLSTSFYAGQYLQNLAPGYDYGGSGWGTPGAPSAPTDPGTFTYGDTYRSLGASASYNYNITKKFTTNAMYSYYASNSWSSLTNLTVGRYDTQYANAGLRYSLAKGLGLRVGYGGTFSGFGSNSGQPQYRGRTIDAGIDYGKSLSLSRRSSLSFGTGVSGAQDIGGVTHYYAIGHVNFDYEIGRSWTVWTGYDRSTNFYQTLGQPTLNDTVNAGLGGLIGRRVDVSGGVSLWRGSYVGSASKSYVSANAFARVQVALNRLFAISTTYSFYHYEFAPGAVVPPGFVQQVDRQSIRVSLNMWAPLMTKGTRRSNASR